MVIYIVELEKLLVELSLPYFKNWLQSTVNENLVGLKFGESGKLMPLPKIPFHYTSIQESYTYMHHTLSMYVANMWQLKDMSILNYLSC